MAKIEQLPVAPNVIRDCALNELDHLSTLIANMSLNEWSRPSAVDGWTIGDVASHLDLFVGFYSRFLSTVLSGRGSGNVAKTFGLLTGSIMPTAAPIFDMINGFVPKAMNRLLSPRVVKRQFAAGARKTRQHLVKIGPDDYTRPVHFEGGPYPLSFYLAIIVNELAIHAWDIESRLEPGAALGREARAVLPWFYWSATALMFRPSRDLAGTVQVSLTDPESLMWWSLSRGSVRVGHERVSHPDTDIVGPSGDYLLALTGRIEAADVLQSSLIVKGNGRLAEAFMSSWHLI